MTNIEKTIYDKAGRVITSSADIYQYRDNAAERFRCLKKYYQKIGCPVITINETCFIYTIAGATTIYEVTNND